MKKILSLVLFGTIFSLNILSQDLSPYKEITTAMSNDNFELVQELSQKEECVNAIDNSSDYNTVLAFAAVGSYYHAAKYLNILFENGAKYEIHEGQSPFLKTLDFLYGRVPNYENNIIEAMTVFLKNGANIDETNENGETALIKSIKKSNSPKIATFLINKGANVNIKDNTGKTVLDYTNNHVYKSIYKDIKIYLISSGALLGSDLK